MKKVQNTEKPNDVEVNIDACASELTRRSMRIALFCSSDDVIAPLPPYDFESYIFFPISAWKNWLM
ncbi:MAG: hypothetical protein M3Q24_01730 [bacterium]|nr:hypothetical protein [bacterium]